ncbi:MAG: extracellular solute-binding protein [Clostridium sp.]
MKKILLLTLLAGSILMSGCSKDTNTSAIVLDKNKPVELTIWHYYNGTQKAAFDALVSEFNETEGKEQGIYVESHSKGDVGELESAVMNASQKKVGSEEMPNIFSSYADTAFQIEKAGALADLSPYFTDEEQSEYVDSYIEEGRIGSNGELKIFPIAKSTEVFMMNKTAWEEFSAETGAKQENLETTEGVAQIAEQYYNWTDAKTPNVLNDGKAFYGRDAMANLFIISSMQRGIELFQVENQKVTLNIDRDTFKEIWDDYYKPSVKGYFGSFGRFRSDDLKIGEIIAYTGSTASASYFPAQIEMNDMILPIECMILPAPKLKGGEAYIIQQGAGMVVTKKTKEEEYASVEFLKWFTQNEQNTEFGCTSCYVPVKKDANRKEVLDSVIKSKSLQIQDKEYSTLLTAYEMVSKDKLYTNKAFDGGAAARKVLEYSLQDKVKADREQILALLEAGTTLEDAVKDYISDEAFDTWFKEIKVELEACATKDK